SVLQSGPDLCLHLHWYLVPRPGWPTKATPTMSLRDVEKRQRTAAFWCAEHEDVSALKLESSTRGQRHSPTPMSCAHHSPIQCNIHGLPSPARSKFGSGAGSSRPERGQTPETGGDASRPQQAPSRLGAHQSHTRKHRYCGKHSKRWTAC